MVMTNFTFSHWGGGAGDLTRFRILLENFIADMSSINNICTLFCVYFYIFLDNIFSWDLAYFFQTVLRKFDMDLTSVTEQSLSPVRGATLVDF